MCVCVVGSISSSTFFEHFDSGIHSILLELQQSAALTIVPWYPQYLTPPHLPNTSVSIASGTTTECNEFRNLQKFKILIHDRRRTVND